MHFHPFTRTVVCQAIALAGFVGFLHVLQGFAPTGAASAPSVSEQASAALFASVVKQEEKKAPLEQPPEPEPEELSQSEPRRPQRFRPSSVATDGRPTSAELPPAARGRPAVADEIPAQPKELPLSYLMKFRSIEEFHAFLDELPEVPDDGSATMSLIRIEGLPTTVPEMRRLFESYRMRPLLHNPKNFSYLITHDMKLLRDPESIQSYIASVGRYLRQDDRNGAYLALRDEWVTRARNEIEIFRAFRDPTEFERMELGLASPHLTRFFRKLEQDTARQLTELTGRPVAVRDLARIDCRFKIVNGVLVLVPWEAQIGTGPAGSSIRIWSAS